MNKALLALGILAVAVPAYEESALAFNNYSTQYSLPSVWPTAVGQYISLSLLAVIGAILILIAAFVNLG